MTLAMPMTRSERTYYAMLFTAKGQLRTGQNTAVWVEGKLRRAWGSTHMTPAAQKARRMRKLVSMGRWH